MATLTGLLLLGALAQSAATMLAAAPQHLLGSLLGGSSEQSCLDLTGFSDGTNDSNDLALLVEVFDDGQQANAGAIIDSARRVGAPPRAWVIAVATAIQESSLRNVGHGDAVGPDSRGLFQQRSPWAGEKERMDPAAATALFIHGGHGGQPGLMDVPGWQNSALISPTQAGRAAQQVQRSAHPDAYARHMEEALAFVAAYARSNDLSRPPQPHAGQASASTSARAWTSTNCQSPPGQSTSVRAALDFARAQLGLPYQWGGNGPEHGDNGFDCSGLTVAAYQAAGITLPRTAQLQYEHGPRVPLHSLQPGDLVFFGTDTAHVTHVGLYLGENRMIDAPHTGAVVRIEDHRWDSLLGATRPAQTG
ncbi:NlpC/P60 family protein [Kineosporia babensis]|uniref:NlpC/P60 family protein n=1 Tax=Kineosporia babensis TaxID=499548 RepID=A0A9X1NKZ9_9ACTN|nr:NlpC/P60 family protein [Kineosporia babensis]